MIARLSTSLPGGPEWLYELKLDGYRALVWKHGPDVRLRSRNNKDLTLAYPSVAAAASRLAVHSVLIDGEIVAVDPSGVPSFQALQHRASHPHHRIVFFAFDLLHVDGESLQERALEERRVRLPAVLGTSGLLLSETLEGSAEDVTAAVRGLGLEGVVAKRRTSRYESGLRTGAWCKVKLDRQQEFVVGGYRPGPLGVDALVVGYHDERGLRFAAKVRSGFTPHLRREAHERLTPHHTTRCPFVDLPSGESTHWGGGVTPEQMPEFQWVKPMRVVQVRFVEWTSEGHLRHAAFLGFRDDKRARDVRREG